MGKSEREYKKQDAFYDKFKPESDIEILEHFVSSEKKAVMYDFQGCFYPAYHYEIKRIVGSAMKGIDSELKVETFYYLLRLKTIYLFSKKHYSEFKIAFSQFFECVQSKKWEAYSNSGKINSTVIFLLFNGIDSSLSSLEKFNALDYADFKVVLSFINKCFMYDGYESLVRKKEQFIKFADNASFIKLIDKNTIPFLISKNYESDTAKTLFGIFTVLYFYKPSLFTKIQHVVEKLPKTQQSRIDFEYYLAYLTKK